MYMPFLVAEIMNGIILSKLKLPRLSSSLVKLCSTSSMEASSAQKGEFSFQITINFNIASVEVIPSDFMADKLYKQIDLELRAHEPAVLKSYSWFLGTAAKELGVKVEKSGAPDEPHKERKTLLKAAYVNKKHRVQYEMRY